jgi:hypothetical protein
VLAAGISAPSKFAFAIKSSTTGQIKAISSHSIENELFILLKKEQVESHFHSTHNST